MIKDAIARLKVRSIVIIVLVIGALVLAIQDKNFRSTFGDLAKIGVGENENANWQGFQGFCHSHSF